MNNDKPSFKWRQLALFRRIFRVSSNPADYLKDRPLNPPPDPNFKRRGRRRSE